MGCVLWGHCGHKERACYINPSVRLPFQDEPERYPYQCEGRHTFDGLIGDPDPEKLFLVILTIADGFSGT